jgi:DNA-binding NarL/FixJ family response regulator
MVRLLIADDHKVLLDGICSYFSDIDDIEVSATAKNGKQVLQILQERDIDIVLLDINMPELNGIETCKFITKRHTDVKVIALSMYKQASYVKRMRSYGAKGYILKDDSAEEMIKAIYSVNKGEEYYSSKLISLMVSSVMTNEKSDRKRSFRVDF